MLDGKNFKRLSLVLCFLLLFATFLPVPVFADIGPKRAITVNFTGAEGEYWVTFLGLSDGPFKEYDQDSSRYTEDQKEYVAWRKFGEYIDADGYPFCQRFEECTNTHEFTWGYFAPAEFKILIYFPQTDTYAVSEVYEQYAFYSYFTVDLSGVENAENLIADGIYNINAKISYKYFVEILRFLGRALLTAIIELALAFAYELGKKNTIWIIAVTNFVTQIMINVALNMLYCVGLGLAVYAGYLLMEIIVTIIEATVYSIVFTRIKNKDTGEVIACSKKKCILYALVANLCTFIIGVLLPSGIPIIF